MSPSRPTCGARARWVAGLLAAIAAPAAAQRPVDLEAALRSALDRDPGVAVARADSAGARAEVRVAGLYPNPDLALGYSRSAPRYHVEVEQAVEYPWVRRPRIEAAAAAARAANLRLQLERARVRFEVTPAYVEAAVAERIRVLSARGAADGVELVRIATARRDEGDASDLDVELARVSAAQLRSSFLTDSLGAIAATLRLQSAMGLPVDDVRITPADTPLSIPAAPAAASLAVAAGEADTVAATARLLERRRARIPAPALRLGFETGDPAGDETGILPTFGVTVPIPLFDRGGAHVAAARAEADRSVASLALVRRDAALAVSLAGHELDIAQTRLEADRTAVENATRVAALSAAAYREGAYPLASVLEAQRSAREAERQFLEDLAAVQKAGAALALARAAGVLP